MTLPLVAFVRLTHRASLWFTHFRIVAGMPVHFPRGASSADLAIQERVFDAVTLLAECDPVRFARISRDLKAILVFPIVSRGVGEYWHDVRVCVLNTHSFKRRPTMTSGEIAAVIVHEATHARLFSNGIGLKVSELVRVERLCVRSEIRFSTRVRDVRLRQTIVKAAAWRLNHLKDPEAYSPRGRFDRQQAAARRDGVPRWLVRIVDRFRPAVSPDR